MDNYKKSQKYLSSLKSTLNEKYAYILFKLFIPLIRKYLSKIYILSRHKTDQ